MVAKTAIKHFYFYHFVTSIKGSADILVVHEGYNVCSLGKG